MQTLYEAAGGADGLRALAAAWHARVMADEVVSHAFSHGFDPAHTERLAAYWAEALGGPSMYTDAYGDETAVVRMHSGNGPHEEMDRRAIACFDQALRDADLAGDERLRRALHSYFTWATTTTMSRYHDSADEVPDGLRIPRWSWHGLVTETDPAAGGPEFPYVPSDDEDIDAAPGWDAIDAAMHALYPGKEPRHWAPKDKLPSVGPGMDGLSAYDAGDHWHFVTYGLTELYSKEPTRPRRKSLLRRRTNTPEPGTAEADDSGFGFEFTLRVPHGPGEEPPAWALTLLESLVDSIFGGLFLAPGHTLDPGGPITGEPTTRLTALVFVKDTQLRPLDTANGFVGFLQVVGITSEELAAIKEDRSFADRLRDGNPLLLTDPTR